MPWFRAIAQRIPDHWGEPKSILGVNVFFNMSERERREILRTWQRLGPSRPSSLRVARHAFRICLVPKPVKYNLTSCLKSSVTRARFQTR